MMDTDDICAHHSHIMNGYKHERAHVTRLIFNMDSYATQQKGGMKQKEKINPKAYRCHYSMIFYLFI